MHCFHPNNLKNKIMAGKLTFISQPESNYIFSPQNYAKLSSLTFQNLISKEIGNLEYKIKLRNFDERINFVLDLPSIEGFYYCSFIISKIQSHLAVGGCRAGVFDLVFS